MELVCNAMICMEKSNHKPIFSFFDEFGSKRTLLGILMVFCSFRLDLELFWFSFVVVWKLSMDSPNFLDLGNSHNPLIV